MLGGNDADVARLLVRLDAFANIAVTTVAADQKGQFRHVRVSLSTHSSMIEEPGISI
jgi:hypothetical protein